MPGVAHSSLCRSLLFETIFHRGQVIAFPDYDAHKKEMNGELTEFFNPSTQSWAQGNSFGVLDSFFGGNPTLWKGMIVLTGGHSRVGRKDKYISDVHLIEYNGPEEGYVPKRCCHSMLRARAYHGSVVFRSCLWIAGGQFGGGSTQNFTNTTEVFISMDGSATNGYWIEGPPMNTIRDNSPRLLVVDDRLYAVAGLTTTFWGPEWPCVHQPFLL